MSNLLERTNYQGYVIEIYNDEDSWAANPRDWDNGTTLCLSHKRYDLPNEGRLPFDSFDSWADAERYIRDSFEVVGPVLTVSMTDHSDTSYYVGLPADQWDSGRVGFIFMDREGQELTGTPEDQIEECLKGDVELFDQWVNGQVFEYRVIDPAGNVIDSLSGIFDDGLNFNYTLSMAKAAVDGDIEGVRRQMAAGLVP